MDDTPNRFRKKDDGPAMTIADGEKTKRIEKINPLLQRLFYFIEEWPVKRNIHSKAV